MIILILLGAIALVVVIAYVLQWRARRERWRYGDEWQPPRRQEGLTQQELGEQLYREDMSEIQVDVEVSQRWRG